MLLRFVAVCLWLVSLCMIYGMVSTWNRPELAARRAENPTLATVVYVVGMALPALGFALLGFACWLRRWTIFATGSCAFLPLVLFVTYHWVRRL